MSFSCGGANCAPARRFLYRQSALILYFALSAAAKKDKKLKGNLKFTNRKRKAVEILPFGGYNKRKKREVTS